MELLTFDMDNTLVHSDKAHVKAFNMALTDMGFKKKKNWDIERHFGKPKYDVARAVVPSNDVKLHKRFILLHDRYLYKETKKYVTRIKGVLTALKKLKKNYRLAVLSNCKHKNIKLLMESAKIDLKLFDLVLGGDEVLHGKPSPDELFKVQRLLHQKPLYHIGDSPYDIRAAKSAKIKSVGVLTGFFTRGQLKKENPVVVLRSVSELPDWLSK